MPYTDPDRQRRAKRESNARTQAKRRTQLLPLEPKSEPAAQAVLPPLAPPSALDLDFACCLLNVGWLKGDTPETRRERVKQAWQRFLAVVEE